MMSVMHPFSPLIRPSWLCRACLRSQRQPIRPHRTAFPHQRATAAGRAVSSAPSKSASTSTSTSNSKSTRILLVVGGGLALGVGIVSFTPFYEDIKHVSVAAQRSYRVLATLVLNIHDYRTVLQHDGDGDYADQLKACHLRCAKRTLRTLEKNGSIFIKLGQHLSSMNYLLPNEWCDTFIPLQDQCPVSSLASIQNMIRRDTGHELSDYFSEFEASPIGAASLAQVHRATERATGRKVAVKVQHPALDEWAQLDLALTSFTFTTLKRWFPEYDLTWLSEEMQASLPQELDFTREGQNATRAREYFARIHDAPVVIPRVIWAKRRILVMEYVAGFRTDDVASLDAHGIDRDEVSAALARVFNEMIFGRDAPLHCDPHGGNLSIRPNGRRHGRANFDVVLYDHGLYRDIPLQLRRDYAKLWLAVLDADEAGMRRYAHAVAGIDEAHFPLFASAITGRDYTVLAKKAGGAGGVMTSRTNEEKKVIGDALGEGLLESLIQLLGRVPRVILLILKTNDLTRSLDEGLRTRQGPMRTFLILARYASRAVYEEQRERLCGSVLWPRNLVVWMAAWWRHMRVELQLCSYETYLAVRAAAGLQPVAVTNSLRE